MLSRMTDGRSEDGSYYTGLSLPRFQVSGSSLFCGRVIFTCPSRRCSPHLTRQFAETSLGVG